MKSLPPLPLSPSLFCSLSLAYFWLLHPPTHSLSARARLRLREFVVVFVAYVSRREMFGRAYVVLLALTCLVAVIAATSTTPAPAPVVAKVEVVGEIASFLENPHYLNNDEIGELFERLAKDYPTLAQPYTIGQTIQNRSMHALALDAATDPNNGDLLRPMVKLVANIQGDETLGRQIVLYMAEYLASSYETDAEVQRLLNTTIIHFLPSCNPDGFAVAKVSESHTATKQNKIKIKSRERNLA